MLISSKLKLEPPLPFISFSILFYKIRLILVKYSKNNFKDIFCLIDISIKNKTQYLLVESELNFWSQNLHE